MQLSNPAYITFIASIILVLSLLIPVDITVLDSETEEIKKEAFDLRRRIAMILLLSIPLAIYVYSINCLQVGNCVVWSWIVTSIILLWIFSFLIIGFAY
jgi:Na+-driven multidrug efflux pump